MRGLLWIGLGALACAACLDFDAFHEVGKGGGGHGGRGEGGEGPLGGGGGFPGACPDATVPTEVCVQPASDFSEDPETFEALVLVHAECGASGPCFAVPADPGERNVIRSVATAELPGCSASIRLVEPTAETWSLLALVPAIPSKRLEVAVRPDRVRFIHDEGGADEQPMSGIADTLRIRITAEGAFLEALREGEPLACFFEPDFATDGSYEVQLGLDAREDPGVASSERTLFDDYGLSL